ncbi:MAG: hypothetical protein R2781_05925 [Flavobacteriaceae bacterium]
MELKSTKSPSLFLSLCFFTLISFQTFAQVGINTINPEGILDISSTTTGFVLPRIALTSTIVSAPVTNPNGGAVAVGTVVYNTATTNTGSNDVVPGIYVWTGSRWSAKFTKKDAELFLQTSALRTQSNAGYQNISNLTSRTFTPKYTGIYKIEISVNFGSGYVNNNNPQTDVASITGNFRFTFDGTDRFIPIHSWGVQGVTNYYLIWEQASIVLYESLDAGTAYSFNLAVDQLDGTAFVNSGNSGNGRGYVGYDVPCSVEFIYLEN